MLDRARRTSENSVHAKFGLALSRWAKEFSSSCAVASRNPLLHIGATKGAKSTRLVVEGVAPCRCRAPAAAPDGLLATVNFGEFIF